MQFPVSSGSPTQVTTSSQWNDNDLQSKLIDFLRFPLIVCVIFIHNKKSSFSLSGKSFGTDSVPLPLFTWSSHLTILLCRVAVPLFFFISGFLFFLKTEFFTAGVYIKKLESRFRSLVIPYLFWNFAFLLLVYAMSLVPSLSGFINKKPEVSVRYILSAFWSADGTLPISYQFWFIRDLMVTVILTPFIYAYIKYLSWLGLFALAMLWYYGYGFPVPGLSMVAIFFFTFGGWFSLNKKTLVAATRKLTYFPLVYPLVVIADLLTEQYEWNSIIHNTGIIIGIFFWFKVVSYLLSTDKIRVHTFLLQSSFFLFAIHEPLLTISKRILFIAFRPQNDLSLTFFFFLVVLIVVVLSLFVYKLLKGILPRFTTVITGSR